MSERINHSQGCLLGLLAGSALGMSATTNPARRNVPSCHRTIAELDIREKDMMLPGQTNGTAELAILLARMLSERGAYTAANAREYYTFWMNSQPFDCCPTIMAELRGECTVNRQSGSVLGRMAPLGIFATHYGLEDQIAWAMEDAEITHPNTICTQACAVYVLAISATIKRLIDPEELYQHVLSIARTLRFESDVISALVNASVSPGSTTAHVLDVLQNAFWQLLHAPCLEDGILHTIQRGGDTSLNASVCGGLLGAVYGKVWIPEAWTETILNCCPEVDQEGIEHPRPGCMWPSDVLELAARLIQLPARMVVPESVPLHRLGVYRM